MKTSSELIRLMFPIHDKQGNVIGFGGRQLHEPPADAPGYNPKYINTDSRSRLAIAPASPGLSISTLRLSPSSYHKRPACYVDRQHNVVSEDPFHVAVEGLSAWMNTPIFAMTIATAPNSRYPKLMTLTIEKASSMKRNGDGIIHVDHHVVEDVLSYEIGLSPCKRMRQSGNAL